MSGSGKGSGTDVLVRLFIPSRFSMVNMYIPLFVSSALFVTMSPGYFFKWNGGEALIEKDDNARDLVMWHTILYMIGFVLTVMFFSLFPRTWPGSEQYRSAFIPTPATS